MPLRKSKRNILRDLGDGLVLRRATPADTEALVALNVRVHAEGDPGEERFIAGWTRALMSGTHPSCGVRDFTVVEDTRAGAIVSSVGLVSQTWSYGGIPFGLGRPNLVSTDPAYRRRGLVRQQFEVVHAWSAKRGHLAQAISGVPHFYRQFGYEMTLPIDGWRRAHRSQVTKLKEGEQEPYRVRAATAADLPFLTRTYRQGMDRYLVAAVRNQAIWRYAVEGRAGTVHVIECASGRRAGLLVHDGGLRSGTLHVTAYELAPGINWLAVTPVVVRYLVQAGEEFARQSKAEFEWYCFVADTKHPVYEALADWLQGPEGHYAYYVRVPDLARFLRHIAPVLEQRLAHSIAVGYTGELRIWCYGRGAALSFAKGRLTRVEPVTEGDRYYASRFPGQTFLHLLFGYRCLEEIHHLYADASTWGDEAVLLSVLFPKQPSHVWAII